MRAQMPRGVEGHAALDTAHERIAVAKLTGAGDVTRQLGADRATVSCGEVDH